MLIEIYNTMMFQTLIDTLSYTHKTKKGSLYDKKQSKKNCDR